MASLASEDYWKQEDMNEELDPEDDGGASAMAAEAVRRGERIALSAFPDVSVEVVAVLPTAGDD